MLPGMPLSLAGQMPLFAAQQPGSPNTLPHGLAASQLAFSARGQALSLPFDPTNSLQPGAYYNAYYQ